MEYKPGSCNIGMRERRNRAVLGASGLLAASLLVGATVYLQLPEYIYIFSFIPFFLGFEGALQALYGFCAHYGQKGVFEKDGNLVEIGDPDHLEADHKMAMKIHAYSLISAGIATTIVYVALQI